MGKRTKLTTQAEAASRKLLEADRLEKKRPVDWSERALNPLYAARARAEATELLQPPPNLVGDPSTELVPASDPDDNGTRDLLLATLDQPNVVSVAASEQRADVATRAKVLSPALDVCRSADARNPVEKMLCHQLAAAHHAGMELLARVKELRELPPAENARLVIAAARMFEVFQSGCVTLQKLKLRGRQHLVVQYQVNVGPGGKAVVAAIERRGARRGRSKRT